MPVTLTLSEHHLRYTNMNLTCLLFDSNTDELNVKNLVTLMGVLSDAIRQPNCMCIILTSYGKNIYETQLVLKAT